MTIVRQAITPEVVAEGTRLLEAAGNASTAAGWDALMALCDLERTIVVEDLPAFYRAVSDATFDSPDGLALLPAN